MVTFLHTVLLSENLKFRTALVVCPLNTILNWVSEFKKWQSSMQQDKVKVRKITDGQYLFYVPPMLYRWLTFRRTRMFQVTELATVKSLLERIRALQRWHDDGGVMIMGYEMYRILSLAKKIQDEELKKELKRILVNPGTVTVSRHDDVKMSSVSMALLIKTHSRGFLLCSSVFQVQTLLFATRDTFCATKYPTSPNVWIPSGPSGEWC